MEEPKEFTTTDRQYQTVIQDHNQCSLCGSLLHFKHQVDFLTLHVREEADCPICHIRLKVKDFPLQ